MKRREFIALLGGATAWPLAPRAQQGVKPIIGYLSAGADDRYSRQWLGEFRRGLAEGGLVEGSDVTIEFGRAEGHYNRLPALANELLSRHVAVFFAGGLPAALAAKQASAAIPIVFVMGADPVKLGLVASLNRPGGQLTGIAQLFGELGGKRLELIRELVPSLAVLAVLSNPDNANAADHLNEIETGARAMGQTLDILQARNDDEIETAFATLAARKDSAVLVADDPLFSVRRDQIVALAARHGVPASYYAREFAVAGGLMSYGSSSRENNRLAGNYVARILRGARPADLPVLQPTTFELVINVKTAKALGLAVPTSLLGRADEVIE